MPKKSKKGQQQALVVVAAIFIIAASVGSTLYFTGAFSGFSPSTDGGSGYRNVTFTDAYLECENFTRQRYGSRLQTLAPDNHSSRFDNATKEYRIYFKLQMLKPPNEPQPQPYWVNCFVSASDGDISFYEVGEAKNIPPQPVGKERGGVFGWH